MKNQTNLLNLKNIIITAGIIFALSFFFFKFTNKTENIAETSIVKKWIENNALIVDVRTPQEFASGNYKGSINIPLSEIENNISRFGAKEQMIVLYCRTGNRSGKAKVILEKHGYKNILNAGGLVNMPE